MLLKQRLWGVDALSWHGAADVLGGGALMVLVHTPALLVLVLFAAVLAVRSPIGPGDARDGESRWLVLMFLGATAVHLQFGRVGWLYRYEAYLIVLGIVANAAALARRLPNRWSRLAVGRRIGVVMLTSVLMFPLVLRAGRAAGDVVAGAADLYRHEYVWSRFFERYPPDGGLIVADLGAVSYYTDVPIVDAGGLGTLELLPARWTDPIDLPKVVRAARARGIRVSIVGGPGGRAPEGWRCVAAWTTMRDPTPNATMWLFAADEEAASHLARDLRRFAAAHPDGFSLAFAGENPRCPVR